MTGRSLFVHGVSFFIHHPASPEGSLCYAHSGIKTAPGGEERDATRGPDESQRRRRLCTGKAVAATRHASVDRALCVCVFGRVSFRSPARPLPPGARLPRLARAGTRAMKIS